MTKQDYASRRDQPECSCPGGKSLPLTKAYPAPGCESMGWGHYLRDADGGTAALTRFCHPVSNDAMPCQGFRGDTSAWTPKAAPFRSSRTFLMSRPSSSLSSILQRDTRSHHPSLRDLHPRLLTSISPTLSGRQAA